ncbi:hypothetical protein ABZ733_37125 [Streptomyces longwoodensis]|uniref:hypothetical protein n=1 Tax=Streptomyces longwoodensis TaxID=68231 RepID=UPI00340FE952
MTTTKSATTRHRHATLAMAAHACLAARIADTAATLCFCLPLTVVRLMVVGTAASHLLGLSDTGPAGRAGTALIGAITICAAALTGSNKSC